MQRFALGALPVLFWVLVGCEAGAPPLEAEPTAPARTAVPPPVPLRAALEQQQAQRPAESADTPQGGSCCGAAECKQAGGGCGCRARGVRCGG